MEYQLSGGNINFGLVKITATILASLFSFIAIGTSLLFFTELAHIRTEMKEQVHKEKNTLCLTFTKEVYSTLKWEEKDKEFHLNGKMYDVSSIENDGDNIMVYCIFDKSETSLRQKLANLFDTKPGSKSPLRLWVKMLLQNYVTPPAFSIPVFHRGFSMIVSPYIFKLHTFENELADPPPRG